MKNRTAPLTFLILSATLAGCVSSGPPSVQKIIEGRKVRYEEDQYQRSRDLQIPPDIIAASSEAQSQLLSEYRIGAVPDIVQEDEVILGERKVTYRRESNLRWIDMDLSPAQTWTLIRGFMAELNFPIAREDLDGGVIESEWLDLRDGPDSGVLGGFFDTVLRRVSDSGERDKFIIRVEARDAESSSVYVAHRHIGANVDNEGLFAGYTPLPPDPKLEIEVLRRMMVYAAQTPEAQAGDAEDQIAEAEEAASEEYELIGSLLLIRKPLDESWLLARIALDRAGFTIEDQDYAERAYYIRHTGGPDSSRIFGESEGGFLSSLFGDEPLVSREIKIILAEAKLADIEDAVASEAMAEISEEAAPNETDETATDESSDAESAPDGTGEAVADGEAEAVADAGNSEEKSAEDEGLTSVTAEAADDGDPLTEEQSSILLGILRDNLP